MNTRLGRRRSEKSQSIGKIVWGLLLAVAYTLSTTVWGILMIPVALVVLIALSPLIFLVAYLRNLLKYLPKGKRPQQQRPDRERPDTAYQPEPVYI